MIAKITDVAVEVEGCSAVRPRNPGCAALGRERFALQQPMRLIRKSTHVTLGEGIARPARTPPSLHVRAALTWLAIFPLVTLGMTVLRASTGSWPSALKAFALTILIVPIAVYLAVPLLLALHTAAAQLRWRSRHQPFGSPLTLRPHMHVIDHHALSSAGHAAVLRELRDRAESLDALYRFGLGQDLQQRELFGSAFAADAELDFSPAAARWGGRSPLMRGRDTIVDTILGMFAGRIATSHSVTNPRIRVAGDRAEATALVEALHVRRQDGARVLLKNIYDVELVRDGQRWAIQRLRIDNIWYEGDPAAIFGPTG
jgi:hypothetical protein